VFQLKATPAEYKASLDRTIAKGWPVLDESGTSRAARQCYWRAIVTPETMAAKATCDATPILQASFRLECIQP
jgi:hypothetical protein